jgi:hypothetical protein
VSGRDYRLEMEDRHGKELVVRDPDLIREVEKKLAADGFDDLKVDGVVDRATLRQLTEFQLKHAIKPSGELDEETFEKLGLDRDRFAR